MNRVPPHDQNAERAVLGSIFVKPETMGAAADILTAEDFYAAAHALIFDCAKGLWAEGAQPNPTIVADALERDGNLEKAGGAQGLADLIYASADPETVESCARIVLDHSIERRLIQAATKITAACYAHERDVLTFAQYEIQAVAREQGGTVESVGAVAQRIMPRFTDPNQCSRLRYCLPDLERHLVLAPGRLVYLAGRTNHGKSALAGKIAWEAAKCGASVLYVTTEMTIEELTMRWMSLASGVNFTTMNTGSCLDDELRDLQSAKIPPTLRAVLREDLDVSRVRALAQSVRAIHGLDLLVVDYLQQMKHPPAERRDLALGETSRQFKMLALRMGIPLLVVAQLNRAAEGRKDGRPAVSDLRESGSLEQDADCVALVWRPWMHDRRFGEQDFRVVVGKNRHDPPGDVEMFFYPETMRIECRTEEW